MGVDPMGHAADDGQFVGLLRELRQELADADAIDVGGDRFVKRAAVVGSGFGFRVEGVEMAGPSPHPDLDDGLRLGGLRGWSGGECRVPREREARRGERGALEDVPA